MTRVRAVYHGHYNVRDQRGHYVKPKTARGHLCHHACCNGTRVHPDKLPVKISRSYLRTLNGPQLERELNEYINYSETHEQGMMQILAELDHRETVERNAAARKVRATERRKARHSEWQDEVYRQWLSAESVTNGNMLNKAGRKADINERDLFTASERTVRKYASDELIGFFESNPRPTRASFLGTARERRAHLAARRIG